MGNCAAYPYQRFAGAVQMLPHEMQIFGLIYHQGKAGNRI